MRNIDRDLDLDRERNIEFRNIDRDLDFRLDFRF
jgi:hypothetical protein